MKPFTEDDVQQTIVEGLTLMRYRVFVTSRRRKRCRKCGFFSTGGDGVSKGLPDLMVTKDSWPKWMFLGIEVKGPKTAVSVEQRECMDAGRYPVVRSWEEALAAVRAFEQEVK